MWVSRRGTKDLDSYFLGGKTLPWYLLGVSDASGMFDISGTMLMVYWLFVYGAKSLWLPFAWPVFNQIFLMMFLSGWLRRSNAAHRGRVDPIPLRPRRGANLAHLSVVLFALLNVIGMLAYAFRGIGEFAQEMLPWNLHDIGAKAFPALFAGGPAGLLSNENLYAIIILALTSLYAVKGGMVSVVITEVMQFFLLSVTSVAIGLIAIAKVSPETIQRTVPEGWLNPFFGKTLGLDWSGLLPHGNELIRVDGNELFAIVFGLMFFKGVLASLAGPAPNYDMQRILATRTPREACLMNSMVNVVLYFPRYMMVTGITVLALAYCMPQIQGMEKQKQFEGLLPIVLAGQVPTGVVGLMLAGLLAAFMSNFAATINAAPAYVVNDVYKRFIDPDCPSKLAVRLSRIASVVILVIGVVFGLLTESVYEIMRWIVGALYSGYVVANVLKWYWWRFNGHGYFWGMASGMAAAMAMPRLAKMEPLAAWIAQHFGTINDLYFIPPILAISTIGCIAGTLLSPPEDDETLLDFYRTTRPWGFWGPIREKAGRLIPPAHPNRDFPRDALNVAVGIVWQLCLTALPIYVVLQQWSWVGRIGVTLAITSVFLKFNWYDKLRDWPDGSGSAS